METLLITQLNILGCYKGRKLENTVKRAPRRHGAKAQKRGISNEYICIRTGIQREGDAIGATVNRAKPSAKELVSIFEGHIADGTIGSIVLSNSVTSFTAE